MFKGGTLGLAAFVGVSTFVLGTVARGTEVSGSLETRRTDGQNSRALYKSYWREQNGHIPSIPRRRDMARTVAVVLVGDIPPTREREPVLLSGGSLLPTAVVARAGTVVTFQNRDGFTHELYAEGLPALAPEAISPDQSRRVQLAKTGRFILRDRRVPHVRGYLHVLPNLIEVARLTTDGRFSFHDVPPGRYTLKVFHNDKEVLSKPITIENERSVKLDPLTLSSLES